MPSIEKTESVTKEVAPNAGSNPAPPAPATVSLEQHLALKARIDDLELQLMEFMSLKAQEPVPLPLYVPATETLPAVMVGSFFNCPECGNRLDGPSLTAINGTRGANYTHTFAESSKLSGKQCRLVGQQFKSPVVLLEFANTPKAADLTAAK